MFLLDKYNLKGTFYIPKDYKKRTLRDSQLKELAFSQEVGAHSLTHPRAWKTGGLSDDQINDEIFGSKKYLEEILGREIKMFCYPYGKFTGGIKSLVGQAGFLGARTTKNMQINFPKDFLEFGTTLRVFPLSFGQTLRFFRWNRLAKNLFNKFLKDGGVYHIWGHSWEVEKYGMWRELEEIFQYIANRDECLYLTNGEVTGNNI